MSEDGESVKANLIAAVVAGIAGLALAIVALVIFSNVYVNKGTDTLFMYGSSPGTPVNDKDDFSRKIYWATTIFLVVPLLVCGLVAAGRKAASGIVVIGSGGSTIGLLFVFMFLWLYYRMNANTPGIINNIADDLAKCCVPEFYNDPTNKCPNYNGGEAIPCVAPYTNLTREALRVNPDFEFLFFGVGGAAALSFVIAVCGYFSVSGKGVLAEAMRLLAISTGIKKFTNDFLGESDDEEDDDNGDADIEEGKKSKKEKRLKKQGYKNVGLIDGQDDSSSGEEEEVSNHERGNGTKRQKRDSKSVGDRS